MMQATNPKKQLQVHGGKVLALAIFATIALLDVPGMYQDWAARGEYNQRYSKMLHLPQDTPRLQYSLIRMPGVVGKGLVVSFYRPNSDEDANLRDWISKRNQFPKLQPGYSLGAKPIGTWEAERGSDFLVMSRVNESGWIDFTVGKRMPPEEAKKDIATFPWKKELVNWQAIASNR